MHSYDFTVPIGVTLVANAMCTVH